VRSCLPAEEIEQERDQDAQTDIDEAAAFEYRQVMPLT